MCGLTGFCDFNKMLTTDHLKVANDVLKHRGPDYGDVSFFEEPTAAIGLGHRRLSILDVSSNGNQPMYSDDKSVVIVLNGEVYNFKEIRSELIQLGYSFHSDSDTEVIIKAYQEFGLTSVDKFIGMFAFVLFDIKKQHVYLFRDRAGVKPLYYFQKNGYVLFASELKSIYSYPVFQKNINEQAVALFFKYGYIRSPHTIFKDTFKVRPGHYIKINLADKKVEEIKYYDVFDYYNKPKLKISENEALEEVEKLFISAFQYRMVSDVPVGIFLSGGYDSSLVAGVLQKNNSSRLKTFTIGFNEEKYNEAPHAKKIAEYLGTDHNEYYCTTKEAQDIFPILADIYDEPFGDSSSIPTTLVSRYARKQVTVSLSADGGDEIFAGYGRYAHLVKVNKFVEMAPDPIVRLGVQMHRITSHLFPSFKRGTNTVNRLSEILDNGGEHSVADVYSRHFTNKDMGQLLPGFNTDIQLYDEVGKINNENDFINTCLALDYKTYMVDDVLVKVDRATMSVGLEGREPLLDNRIIEFVSQLPSELKFNNGDKKYLLKKIAHKYIPKALLDRPKSGFALPVYEWLKHDLKDYLFYYINEEQLSKHNFIDVQKAISLRDGFLSGKNRKETQIWLLLMFQMWWNKWM
jgi:asparagine synthase (glutamine-hydrolysing)